MTVAGQSLAAQRAWDQLNDRQRVYLAAIYEADQAAEARIAESRKQMQWVPPASEWRWLRYTCASHHDFDTAIQELLRRQGHLDSGAGSTLAALERRGLIDTRTVPDGIGITIIEVRMTRAGRAAVRAGQNEAPKTRTPPGLLSEWLWTALTTLYLAGPDGVLYDYHGWDLTAGHPERGPSWSALLKFRDRPDGSFMELFRSGPETRERARIADRGRFHVELHHRCYAELYPHLPRLDGVVVIEGAHTGLASHRARRPRGLVTGPEWRLLAALTRCERDHRCRWRDQVVNRYRIWGQPVPAEVEAIPDGLTLAQAHHTANSKAAVDRLLTYQGGPLIEIVTGEALQEAALVCLTDTGRNHMDNHTTDYRQMYPEIGDIP